MKDKINNIFNPKDSIVWLGLFTIIFSLYYLIKYDGFGTVISYILYLIMTYSLIIICIRLYKIVKKYINKIINKNKYLTIYKNDLVFRYKVSLILSIMLNILFSIFKLITGIIYKSSWFICFGIYYLLLVILRIKIGISEFKVNKNLKEEYYQYRLIAIILLLTNIIVTMIILIIINQKITNIYPTTLAITSSVYTFYLITISIYNLIKYRKLNNPLISSSKVISVITSLISLISLETILIPTFGTNNYDFFNIMIMSTGLGITIIITVIVLYMIIKSTEWINEN